MVTFDLGNAPTNVGGLLVNVGGSEGKKINLLVIEQMWRRSQKSELKMARQSLS